MLAKIGNSYKESLLLFNRRRGTMLAASSTFYILLTIVPFFLLMFRVIGLFLGETSAIHNHLFTIGTQIFPDVAPEIILKVKNLISAPLYGGAKFTLINFVILTISSLSFFNAIWSGLFLISGDRTYLKANKHFKGIVIITVTILLVLLLFSIQPVLFFLTKFLQTNIIFNYINAHIEVLPKLISNLTKMNLSESFLFQSNILLFVFLLFYFTFIYRWLLDWKIRMREALLCSGTFVFLLILGKNLFWIYFFYIRETLITNYGDYYTFIIGLIWIYLLMCFFFFGASLSVVLLKKPLFDIDQIENENVCG